MNPTDQDPLKSNTYRLVTGIFGGFLLILGLIILAVSSLSVGAVIAALVVGGLGAEAIFSAVRNKISLLSKIGPLP